MNIFVGKQPIFGSNENIEYYELLYRSSNKKNSFTEIDEDQATIEVLLNAFLRIGLENLTNNKPCFVNFSENLLMHDLLDSFDPRFLVIEILETVPITPKVIERIRYLKQLGFRFALDDFFLQVNVDCYFELFELVDYIKMDFSNAHIDERLMIENLVNYQYKHIQLLAEKVEMAREYEEAKKAGYTLFQGYYFEHPKVITHTDIPTNTIFYYEIMSLLNEDEPNMEKLVGIIKRDVSLTFRILQLANTIKNNIHTEITSIRHAITLIGFKELHKWIYLLSIRTTGEKLTEVQEEAIQSALIRAKLCELMATAKSYKNSPEFYLVGMFSNIETILKRPMEMIVATLPFSENIIQTLLGHQTKMTPILECSIALQKLNWSSIDKFATDLHFTSEQLTAFYNKSIRWANEIQHYKHIVQK